MKRRCNIMRDAELQAKVHAQIAAGHKVQAIVQSLGTEQISRAALYRYVQQYRAALAKLEESKAPSADEFSSPHLDGLHETLHRIQKIGRALEARDLNAREGAIRSHHDANPASNRRLGASPESIEFIKKKILGLDV